MGLPLKNHIELDSAFNGLKETPGVKVTTVSRSSSWDQNDPEIASVAQKRWRPNVWELASHITGFLWLLPILALLTLNSKSYVLGATIWCPSRKCTIDYYHGDPFERSEQLAAGDQSALAGLQFVAKALEVWFIFVSTSLIYDVAMLLANSRGGLPLGLLFAHLEFADIRFLFRPQLWRSTALKEAGIGKSHVRSVKLYLFVGLVAFLSILTNLMGPAIAVLVLPNLQWIETTRIPQYQFNWTQIEYGPVFNDTLPGCTDADIDNLTWGCTSEVYGPSLDSYAKAAEAATEQDLDSWSGKAVALSQEGSIQYGLNGSVVNSMTWAPNRQVLRELSFDVVDVLYPFMNSSQVDPHSPDMRQVKNSLSTLLERDGISYGYENQCFPGNKTTIVVNEAEDQMVTCYSGWKFSNPGNGNRHSYTKCIRTGLGWPGMAENGGQLLLAGPKSQDNAMTITHFISPSATYFNQTTDFGSGIRACLAHGATGKCDWGNIFKTEMPPELRNSTKNTLISEYDFNHSSLPNARVWCDSHVYMSFPTYSFDISERSNPLHLVQLKNISQVPTTEPALMNPEWLLVAWSVANGDTVPYSRPITQEFRKAIPLFYKENETSIGGHEFSLLHHYSLSQALSLVSFAYVQANETCDAATCTGPVFSRYALLHVWAFGLSDQASQLSSVVVGLGAACVLIRLLLAVRCRPRRDHSSVELIAAALRHRPQREIEDVKRVKDLTRLRCEVVETKHGEPVYILGRPWPCEDP